MDHDQILCFLTRGTIPFKVCICTRSNKWQFPQITGQSAFSWVRKSGFGKQALASKPKVKIFESKSAFIHKAFWQKHMRGRLSFIHSHTSLLELIYTSPMLLVSWVHKFYKLPAHPPNLLLLWLTMKLLMEHAYL